MYRACTLTPWNFQLEVANATTGRAQRVSKGGRLRAIFIDRCWSASTMCARRQRYVPPGGVCGKAEP